MYIISLLHWFCFRAAVEINKKKLRLCKHPLQAMPNIALISQKAEVKHLCFHFCFSTPLSIALHFSLILKRFTVHKSLCRFMLQSHFDTIAVIYGKRWAGLPLMKCTGYTFYESILKGGSAGHDHSSLSCKTAPISPLFHMPITFLNIYLFYSWALPKGDFKKVEGVTISAKLLQLISNEDKNSF